VKTPRKILFVDDDANFLAALRRTFRNQFIFDTANSGQEALHLLKSEGPYAVIVVDIDMPGISGIELLSRLSAESPKTVQVVLTGKVDLDTFVESVERGKIFRYVAKSFDGDALRSVLWESLKQYDDDEKEIAE
jgi:DNA-binding NtrC family response regulator